MSEISFEVFLAKLSEDLEIAPELLFSTDFGDLEDFDSMSRIITGVVVEDLFGFEIDVIELDSKSNASELYDFCRKAVTDTDRTP